MLVPFDPKGQFLEMYLKETNQNDAPRFIHEVVHCRFIYKSGNNNKKKSGNNQNIFKLENSSMYTC